jgi:hypothetical protein
VPKLWAKLRRAVRKGDGSAEKHHETMREIAEAVEHFVEREMLALLEASPAWKSGPLRVAHVELASNRIRVHIERGEGREAHHGYRDAATSGDDDARLVTIAFEEQSGWLVAGVPRPAWTAGLSPVERVLFENALAGVYQRSGVDLVREQLQAALPGAPPYDVSDEGLVVWPDGRWTTELIYPLEGQGTVSPAVRGESPATPPPALDLDRILFHEQTITWTDWVAAWSAETPPRVVKGDALLPA